MNLVSRLAQRGALGSLVAELFHGLRVAGDRAVHEGQGDHREAAYAARRER